MSDGTLALEFASFAGRKSRLYDLATLQIVPNPSVYVKEKASYQHIGFHQFHLVLQSFVLAYSLKLDYPPIPNNLSICVNPSPTEAASGDDGNWNELGPCTLGDIRWLIE